MVLNMLKYNKNSILCKIFGIVLIVFGLIILSVDYIIIDAIGELFKQIAIFLGVTGMAILGVQIIGYLLLYSIIVFLAIVAILLIIIGISVYTSRFKI